MLRVLCFRERVKEEPVLQASKAVLTRWSAEGVLNLGVSVVMGVGVVGRAMVIDAGVRLVIWRESVLMLRIKALISFVSLTSLVAARCARMSV
jgi:uncharacterized protein (DUF983 family)